MQNFTVIWQHAEADIVSYVSVADRAISEEVLPMRWIGLACKSEEIPFDDWNPEEHSDWHLVAVIKGHVEVVY